MSNKGFIKKNSLSIYRKRRRRVFFCMLVVICLVVLFFIFYTSVTTKSTTVALTDQQFETASNVEGVTVGLYPIFCRAESTNLALYLPVEIFDVLCMGYHQANSDKAFELVPSGTELKIAKDEKITLKNRDEVGELNYFVMTSRGRGTSLTSAVDVAVHPNTWIKSPVDGKITKIKTYQLDGKFKDFHIEIEPLGYPELRVVVIHLNDLDVVEGDTVKARETLLGKVRNFGQVFQSQIERHVPKECDHVHFQVNRYVEGED